MEWKELSKIEAAAITGEWNSMNKEAFDTMAMEWNETLPENLDEDYRAIRLDLIEAETTARNKVESSEEYSKKKDYFTDLFFAEEVYKILEKHDLSPRVASNDKVWIYLCVKVVPDIVKRRYNKSTKKTDKGMVVLNVSEDRYWKKTRRIYLKTLWWYFYLSMQTDDAGKPDLAKTVEILKGNSTDEIVQLTERSGTAGYRVDVYRNMMRFYADNRDKYDNETFRKVMVLNTARTRIVEPSLLDGGTEAYVKELFEYFDK